MAIARTVGQTPQAAGGTSIQSIAVTLPQAVVAGNAIMAVGKYRADAGTLTFSDNLGNTWANDTAFNADLNNGIVIGSAKNLTAGGACTVTFTMTDTANRMGIVVMEYSGFTGGAVFDQTAQATGSSTSPDSGATPTTTAADELLIGGGSDDGAGVPYTWTNSFTKLAESGLGYGRVSAGDRIVASTGAYNATATLGTSTGWRMVIATYKAAGGGGGGASIPYALRPMIM